MGVSVSSLWDRYKKYSFHSSELGLSLDLSRTKIDSEFLSKFESKFSSATSEMIALEKGEIANADEKRMVGHYWLRAPELAPSPDISKEISANLEAMLSFASKIHQGEIKSPSGVKFNSVLLIGIGGSALGPQFVSQALSGPEDKMKLCYFDNTDPDGMRRVLASLPSLESTLCVVISKSGGTKETRNGQLIAKEAWRTAGLDFSKSFVAITMEGSELDGTAKSEGWLARFPMWDWVGGRTSELSAVGLLPAALQGFDIKAILNGAKAVDQVTRATKLMENPAGMLAAAWYHAGCGKGGKDMVIIPYKDRLELFSRYLQQLVMESLGKELDRDQKVVNQGIAVYGNKGSTDQHAYVQQLRDGLNNFFLTFIEVLHDESASGLGGERNLSWINNFQVEPKITAGDYLAGFFMGTRSALFEKDRESITITVEQVSAKTVGSLIALFERAVGFYASFVNINAYHQPGVEAGKKAAAQVLELQKKVVDHLSTHNVAHTAESLAGELGAGVDPEDVFRVLRRLSVNSRVKASWKNPIWESEFSL